MRRVATAPRAHFTNIGGEPVDARRAGGRRSHQGLAEVCPKDDAAQELHLATPKSHQAGRAHLARRPEALVTVVAGSTGHADTLCDPVVNERAGQAQA